MVTNSTIETLLNRRSIRKFVAEPFDDDTVATLETVAQHAASSQYLNDWSAVRVKDPALKKRMSEIGRQPYIAEAPLLYVRRGRAPQCDYRRVEGRVHGFGHLRARR